MTSEIGRERREASEIGRGMIVASEIGRERRRWARLEERQARKDGEWERGELYMYIG